MICFFYVLHKGEKLTIQERVTLVFGKHGAIFNFTHPEPEKTLSHTTVCRLIKRSKKLAQLLTVREVGDEGVQPMKKHQIWF